MQSPNIIIRLSELRNHKITYLNCLFSLSSFVRFIRFKMFVVSRCFKNRLEKDVHGRWTSLKTHSLLVLSAARKDKQELVHQDVNGTSMPGAAAPGKYPVNIPCISFLFFSFFNSHHPFSSVQSVLFLSYIFQWYGIGSTCILVHVGLHQMCLAKLNAV